LIRAEKVASLLFILLALYVGFESRKYPLGTLDNPGPGFLPLLLAVAMAVMAVLLAVDLWKNRTAAAPRPFWPGKAGLSKVTLTYAVIVLFTALLDVTGYMANIFLLFLVLLRPIGRLNWTWSLAISAGATLAAYLLFDQWLMIPLPRGIGFGH